MKKKPWKEAAVGCKKKRKINENENENEKAEVKIKTPLQHLIYVNGIVMAIKTS